MSVVVLLDAVLPHPPPRHAAKRNADDTGREDGADFSPVLVLPVMVDRVEVAEVEDQQQRGGHLVGGHDEHHQRERQDARAAGEAGLADALDEHGDGDQHPEQPGRDAGEGEFMPHVQWVAFLYRVAPRMAYSVTCQIPSLRGVRAEAIWAWQFAMSLAKN
jgi:hypothetical protein